MSFQDNNLCLLHTENNSEKIPRMDDGKAMEKGKPTGKTTMQVDLSPAAQAAVKSYSERVDRPQKALLSRLILWFVAQPLVVRRVAQKDVDEGLEEAYAVALEELARRVRAGEMTVPGHDPPRATLHPDIAKAIEDDEGNPLGGDAHKSPKKPRKP